MKKKIIFMTFSVLVVLFLVWVFSSFDLYWFLRYGGKVVGKQKSFCYDTDDDLAFYDKAVVYGLSSGGVDYRYFDSCLDDHTLQEWRCVNLEPDFSFFECPNGCLNGRCKI